MNILNEDQKNQLLKYTSSNEITEPDVFFEELLKIINKKNGKLKI
jgi:hypothetical protein